MKKILIATATTLGLITGLITTSAHAWSVSYSPWYYEKRQDQYHPYFRTICWYWRYAYHNNPSMGYWVGRDSWNYVIELNGTCPASFPADPPQSGPD